MSFAAVEVVQPFEVAQWAAWIAVGAFAAWRGDAFVRSLAWVFLAASAAAAAALASGAPPAVWIAADVVILPILMQALLQEPRRWLAWACAFELVTMATHVARSLDPRIGDGAYAMAIHMWWALELAALVWGACETRTAPAPAALARTGGAGRVSPPLDRLIRAVGLTAKRSRTQRERAA